MKNSFENILLSSSQNYELDSEAMLQGIPSIELMENAGKAVFKNIPINIYLKMFFVGSYLISYLICGGCLYYFLIYFSFSILL